MASGPRSADSPANGAARRARSSSGGDERAWIARARTGSRVAFARLWQVHGPHVRALVASLTPAGAVDDVVQDVAVAALAGIRGFRGESGFATWLAAIARHRAASARELLRRQRARTAGPCTVDDVLAPAAAPSERRDVRALLRQLPRSYRRPLWLRFVGGCSAPEIATRLGTTQGTVRVTLCRALQRLRGAPPTSWAE